MNRSARAERVEATVAEVVGGARAVLFVGLLPPRGNGGCRDRAADPGEAKNLAGQGKHASVLEAHRKLLGEWEAHLKVAPGPARKRTAEG